ncbi:protein of unknown function [Taphrina deformans PYCC 5710]|uniref:UDP-galactose transporter n=1 Tax=Taphrina deformans (strain PYCC 5710 / ATCC 11124 / CBS 356.35 / IMI 108563 / JCM 9778 / NBRC 8474) TaxID=1097556 RepID=R4XKP1_TAPDE|nr:protein of unknown function [Taphrina deformans PYCC 5710]|eukprot:CCG85004.1 protein of unknown function [Taphrina deformans PYCC 5710]
MPVPLDDKWRGVPIKYIALPTLAIQNAAAALITHYSRVMPEYKDERYYPSTAVLLSEVLKLFICFFAFRAEHVQAEGPDISFLDSLRAAFPSDSYKLAIPAALFTLQNNLQYVAISNLDAAMFQVTYQMKIITTAIFSVILFRKQLSWTKWGSLLLLTAGVAMVSLPSGAAAAHSDGMNMGLGLIAVSIASVSSGLAGVYFEKVLKGSQSSLFKLNIPLSAFSIVPALFLGVMLKDGQEIYEKGFFYGYNYIVWITIVIQALGGLIVATCVLYADNIMKNFATSSAVIISALASVFLFEYVISLYFVVGTTGVLLATYIYGLPDALEQSSDTSEESKPLAIDEVYEDSELQPLDDLSSPSLVPAELHRSDTDASDKV